MTHILPTAAHVYVKPEPLATVSKGGIELVANTNKHRKGTVLAVGPDVDELQPGDLIAYAPRNHVDMDGNHLCHLDYVEFKYN